MQKKLSVQKDAIIKEWGKEETYILKFYKTKE